MRGTAVTEVEFAARRLSDELIDELKAADTIVIGAPMYNFSVPTTLRAWFDHVLRAGVTFSYADGAPRGLLGGKRVIVIESRGGLYSEGRRRPSTSRSRICGTCSVSSGITDVTFVRAEKIGYGPEARTAAVEAAQRKSRSCRARESAASDRCPQAEHRCLRGDPPGRLHGRGVISDHCAPASRA